MSSSTDKTAPKGVEANNGVVSAKTPARFVTIDAEMAERRLDNFLMAELRACRARTFIK